MKKTNNYKINREDKTITITREFAKRANIINSDEYRALVQFNKDYPEYKVVQRTASKNTEKDTHKGLTVKFMQKVVDLQESAATANAEFKSVLAFYKGHPAYYSKVKAWFLNKYPNYDIFAPAQNEDDTPLETTVPAPAPVEEVTTIDPAA